MERAINETNRRRALQLAYNEKHGITPETIKKEIGDLFAEWGIEATSKGKGQKAKGKEVEEMVRAELVGDTRPVKEILKEKEKAMLVAAENLEFEYAAALRDEINYLKAMKNYGR
jgi:excinuclease ABC subunit B